MIVLGPLLHPVALAFGIDPVHFAMVYIFNCCTIGAFTPPMGYADVRHLRYYQVSDQRTLSGKRYRFISCSRPISCCGHTSRHCLRSWLI